MQRKHWFIIIILVAIVQLTVPLYMIWNKEQTIRRGNTFLFEIAPIDPTHPLKGKYIILDFLPLSLKVKKSIDMHKATFATLAHKNNQTFNITHLSNQPPSHTTDYIKVNLNQWIIGNQNKIDSLTYNVQFPFNEYYMEENKAPIAESLYRELATGSTFKAFAVVKVYNGDAVVTDVLLNGKSIHEWIP